MIKQAQAVLAPCSDLSAALSFYCDDHGFRVERISPADDPAVAYVVRDGLRLCLDRAFDGAAPTLRVAWAQSRFDAPDGVTFEPLTEAALEVPDLDPSFVVSRGDDRSTLGRAGMRYRDLIAGRQGGRFIASHIEIEEGGPVADYVHFHDVRFQMIYCRRGWVRVVYQGQGAPFVLEAGDCVLQPPGIRHRVLEASDHLEVIEVSSPALHDTFGELELELPDGTDGPGDIDDIDEERTWSGQRFVRHVAAEASWKPWRQAGWSARATGIKDATGGLATALVARCDAPEPSSEITHDGELRFLFVLAGNLDVITDRIARLAAGDAVSIPPGFRHRLVGEAGTELLEVQL